MKISSPYSLSAEIRQKIPFAHAVEALGATGTPVNEPSDYGGGDSINIADRYPRKSAAFFSFSDPRPFMVKGEDVDRLL